MTHREQKTTGAAPFSERFDAWSDAVKACQTHAKLGQTLQNQGIQILQIVQDGKGEPEAAAKLIAQATASIEKGVKIEREALREKIDLQLVIPK